MSFIEVELSKWECEKVEIGIPPKGKTATFLYDGKIPILKICSDDPKNKFVLFSYKGCEKNMVYDAATKSFTDKWSGDWSINFQITKCVADAKEEKSYAAKILEIFTDLENKVNQEYETFKPAVNYSYLKEKNSKTGIEKIIGIDESKGAYLKVKVPFDAPLDSPTFKNNLGKEVPILENRFPKAKFFDITRCRNEIQIPLDRIDSECNIAMNAIPKIMIGIYCVNGIPYITKRILHCYYEPITMKSDSQDDDLISMLRANLTLEEGFDPSAL